MLVSDFGKIAYSCKDLVTVELGNIMLHSDIVGSKRFEYCR